MASHNLPPQSTSFIGRRLELTKVSELLTNPACRLLTLVGAGGVGKTRLAIKVASHQVRRFPDGIYFVGLQPIAAVDNIVPTIASAVGFAFYDGDNPTAQLLRHLYDKHLLLILDNFEHLLPAKVLFP